MIEVLKSTEKVAQKSRYVRISPEALIAAVRRMVSEDIVIPPWDSRHHFFDGGGKTVAYFLVLDTVNFCFWAPKGGTAWEIDFEGGKVSGYYALAAALKKAFEEDRPISGAEELARLSVYDLRRILGGRGELQMMDQRAANLNELGRFLLDECDGDACRLVEVAGHCAVSLAELLAEKLSSYRDVSDYDGDKVFFYKRAQILAADLYGAFQGRGWGALTDIRGLTAFADYKLPQVLRQLGILEYAPELADRVDRLETLAPGCPEEVEIRANTIRAVEGIRRELEKLGKDLKAMEIDWFLWNMGQEERFRKRPYHRTLTMFY